MTVLTSAPPATVRPVPWHRMGWVAWRRFRPTVLGLVVLVGALSAYLLYAGNQVRSAYDAVGTCRPPIDTPDCQFTWMTFVEGHADPGFLGPLLLLLPGLVGAFVGAPILGRELETGVFRYSWTQGIGRTRWAAGLIVPAALGVALLMGLFGLLVTWRNWPIIDSGAHHRLDPSMFPSTGVAIIGWAMLAFSGGVLAGLLWRKTIPAIVSAFAVWFGLLFLAASLRLTLWTPLTTTRELRTSDTDLEEWWTKDGSQVSTAEINDVLEDIGAQMHEGALSMQVDQGATASTDPMEYLRENGYTLVHSYQPDSRYWPIQLMELGVLLALSAVLLGVTFWLLRRRSA